MRKTLIALAAATFGLAALPAQAVDNGIYLGAGVGQAGVEADGDFEGVDFDYDADSTGFKGIIGWRFLDWLSVEGNYVDLGSGDDRVSGERVGVDVSGVSLSAVGFLPLGPVDLFARVGGISWDADVSEGDLSTDGTDLTYGVGAQFRVWSLGIRAEYEVFDLDAADTVDMISVGLTWTFL